MGSQNERQLGRKASALFERIPKADAGLRSISAVETSEAVDGWPNSAVWKLAHQGYSFYDMATVRVGQGKMQWSVGEIK